MKKKPYTQKQALMAIESLFNTDPIIMLDFKSCYDNYEKMERGGMIELLNDVRSVFLRISNIVHGLESDCCEQQGLESLKNSMECVKIHYGDKKVKKYFKNFYDKKEKK